MISTTATRFWTLTSIRNNQRLQQAVIDLCDKAVEVVRDGTVLLVLSDRALTKDKLPIPAAMAVGAIHARLVEENLRCDANIIVETATARDPPICCINRLWCSSNLPISGLSIGQDG